MFPLKALYQLPRLQPFVVLSSVFIFIFSLKNDDSNFRIAVVYDMWITGFDVPSLFTMYIDKPLQRHTHIQTISRVNRIFDGKDKGIVVDYAGIKENMMVALKTYRATTRALLIS